jgi:hypothetical protein
MAIFKTFYGACACTLKPSYCNAGDPNLVKNCIYVEKWHQMATCSAMMHRPYQSVKIFRLNVISCGNTVQ